MIKASLLILLIFTFSGLSCAQTSVWQVSKGEQSVFLGGTIHLLSDDDYPLPAAYGRAYRLSDTLVFEVDSRELKKPQQQRHFARLMRLNDGQTMAELLSPDTHQQLRAAAVKRGLPIAALKQFSPVLITIQLTVMEMKAMGMTAPGVDDFFLAKAGRDSKTIDTLETSDEQMQFIKNLARGNEDEFVRYSLQDLDSLPKQMALLKAAWRSGDRQALISAGIAQWKSTFPGVYQQLLVQRNRRWLPKIESMFNSHEREFILVGALHLVGEDGLLNQLQQRGYQIKQL